MSTNSIYIAQSLRTIRPYLWRMEQHPFQLQLYLGTLPISTFNQFLRQDIYYLSALSQTLKLIATRQSNEIEHRRFQELSNYIQTYELKLQQQTLGYKPTFFNHAMEKKTLNITMPNANTVAYITHLQQQAQHQPLAIAIASCLPCFVLYHQLGLKQYMPPIYTSHPYQKWLSSYKSPRFKQATEDLLMGLEIAALTTLPNVNALNKVIRQSCQYELNFLPMPHPSQAHLIFEQSMLSRLPKKP